MSRLMNRIKSENDRFHLMKPKKNLFLYRRNCSRISSFGLGDVTTLGSHVRRGIFIWWTGQTMRRWPFGMRRKEFLRAVIIKEAQLLVSSKLEGASEPASSKSTGGLIRSHKSSIAKCWRTTYLVKESSHQPYLQHTECMWGRYCPVIQRQSHLYLNSADSQRPNFCR